MLQTERNTSLGGAPSAVNGVYMPPALRLHTRCGLRRRALSLLPRRASKWKVSQVLRPPPLKIASTAEHVHRVATRAREGHGDRKVDTKDADETGEARSTAPRAGRRGGR
mgnify:CR=1 FL=1